MWILAAAFLSTAIPGSASAATVELLAHDNQGHALADVHVALMPYDSPPGPPGSSAQGKLGYTMAARGVTGIDGKLTLPDVPVGTYLVRASATKDRYLISPGDDRFAPPLVITVRDAADRIPVELVYTRGDLVTVQAWANDRGANMTVSFVEQATRREVRTPLNPLGYGEVVLPPGRWEASVPNPPEGFLLRSLERDRQPLPGSTTIIEVTEGSNIIRLTWTYEAPCTVRGVLTCSPSDDCYASIQATLEKPGPWQRVADERGGSDYRHASAGPDELGRYELRLADGVWRIEAAGQRISSRSPESVLFDLAPGDTRQQDFHVTIEPVGDQAVLNVAVRAPDGRGVVDASVAVWPLEGSGGQEPVRRAKTIGSRYNAGAAFRGLPKGSYRIAAGHLEYTEGTVDLPDFEGAPGGVVSRTIVLGAGGSVRAHATDQTEKNAAGVDLVVERIGDPAPSRVGDDDLDKKRSLRRATTDASGWAGIEGLDAGSYRVKPVLAGPRAETHVAKIAEGDDTLKDVVEIALPENGTAAMTIALHPAAGIRNQLACTDRGPVPRAVAFRIFPFPLGLESLELPDEELARLAVLAKKDVPLSGKSLDTLTAGPLAAGSFALAVRPMGHDRWTYEGGTEDITRAIPLTLEESKIADGGFFDIDCGPTVRVRPMLRSQDPLPDLREAHVETKIERVEPSTLPASDGSPATTPSTRDGSPAPTPYARDGSPASNLSARDGSHASTTSARDGSSASTTSARDERPASTLSARDGTRASSPVPPPAVERSPSRITLRKLPEEKLKLSITVSDPFFIPETIEVAPVVLSLERGRESVVPVTVPEIGGVLEIAAGEASRALVTDAAGRQRHEDARDGLVRVTSLKAGSYSVRLCLDRACSKVSRTWDTVTVAPAQVTNLR